MNIRAMIVDDEPLAREKLRRYLADEKDVEVIGECSNGREAVAAIRRRQADVVFLDIQMPELDGFGVVEASDPAHLPFVVFVTAHDAYAVKAFEVHALDYLLKPFDRERLHDTLARVRKSMQRSSSDRYQDQILSLLKDLRADRKRPDRLLIRSAGRIFFLDVEEIDWVEAEGNYLSLHAGEATHLVRETMSSMEERLGPSGFVRIHRSTIVNLNRLKELRPWFEGESIAILKGGKKLPVGKSYRRKLASLTSRLS